MPLKLRKQLMVWGLLLTVAWLRTSAVHAATAAAPMRAVIVFDTSGSMHENDPHRLSQVAAQLFLELARPQDQVGLVAFSSTGSPLMPLTRLSALTSRIPFIAKLRALRFTGQTTDLAAALEVGLSSFPEQSEQNSHDLVLLLTDGKLDLGKQRRAAEPLALSHIRKTLLPLYRQRKITLYTIAFTADADQALLQEMAQVTSGEFRFIPNAATLHKAFSDLFILAQQAESLPMRDGSFLLDESIEKASLVLSKQNATEQIELVTPQQKRLHAGSSHPGVKWDTTPSYDLVQLTKPEPGAWQVEKPSGVQEGIAIVGASTLHLQVEVDPAYLEVGEPFSIAAFLVKNEQLIRDPQRLRELTVQARVTMRQGETRNVSLQPQEAGRFVGTLAPFDTPRRYEVVVTATGPSLQRQRTLSLTLHPQCFRPAIVAGPPIVAQVTLTTDCPIFSKLALEVSRVTGEEPATWVPLKSDRPRTFQTTLASPPGGQSARATIRIHGRRAGEDAFTLVRGPFPLPTASPPEQDWMALAAIVGRQLLLLNVCLGLLGGGGYGIYRYRIQRRRASHG